MAIAPIDTIDQRRGQPHRPCPIPGDTTGDSATPIYHYTTGDRFVGIMRACEIRPSRGLVAPPEIPAVRLSTASEWEGSANKGVIVNNRRRTATLQEMIRLCGSLVRIRIDPANAWLIPSTGLKSALCIPSQTFKRLLESGREMGADPLEWWASALPIPASAFISVEFALDAGPVHWIYSQILARAHPPGLPILPYI